MATIKVGDLLRSDSGKYVSVVSRVERDPKWKCAGWRVLRLNNGTGDGHGFTEFLADYLASSYRVVALDGPWEVAPRTGGDLEERFTADGGIIRRELRRVEVAS